MAPVNARMVAMGRCGRRKVPPSGHRFWLTTSGRMDSVLGILGLVILEFQVRLILFWLNCHKRRMPNLQMSGKRGAHSPSWALLIEIHTPIRIKINLLLGIVAVSVRGTVSRRMCRRGRTVDLFFRRNSSGSMNPVPGILGPVFLIFQVWPILFHLDGHKMRIPYPQMTGEGGTHAPVSTIQIEIHTSHGIKIDLLLRIVAVSVHGMGVDIGWRRRRLPYNVYTVNNSATASGGQQANANTCKNKISPDAHLLPPSFSFLIGPNPRAPLQGWRTFKKY
jgi:hypothetical protein